MSGTSSSASTSSQSSRGSSVEPKSTKKTCCSCNCFLKTVTSSLFIKIYLGLTVLCAAIILSFFFDQSGKATGKTLNELVKEQTKSQTNVYIFFVFSLVLLIASVFLNRLWANCA